MPSSSQFTGQVKTVSVDLNLKFKSAYVTSKYPSRVETRFSFLPTTTTPVLSFRQIGSQIESRRIVFAR